MKFLDKFLRAWRTRIALRYIPTPTQAVLDIGCGDDGFLLRRLAVKRRDGIDPGLAMEHVETGLHLARGRFPDDLNDRGMIGPYDAILALAVFEHLADEHFERARDVLPSLLRPGGRLILTVPHPLVDRILDVLLFFRLIDGQAVDEHHGFDPSDLSRLASAQMRLHKKTTFQLGLNNLFVFERIPS